MANWTDEQKQAIYKKGNNILVAAAAGSGKTAVLVERMIHKIIDDKIDIDKILVVTFTNAAASEMRERILDAIYKKLEEDPNNEHLQRQITLLNLSNICTIDSFCLEVVKSNFYELENMSPNFRIADTPEIELLKEEVLEDLFEEKYEQEDEDFASLITTYTTYRDDTPLKDLVKKIHNYIYSNPFPQKWLHEKVEMFNLKEQGLMEKDFKETIWGSELLKELEEECIRDMDVLDDVQNSLSGDNDLDVYYQIILSDINQIKNLKNSLDSWDKAYEVSKNTTLVKWSTKRIKSEIKDEAKKMRDMVKTNFNDKRSQILISNSLGATQDLYDMYQKLHKLENLINEFDTRFSNKKRERNIVDFTDVEHMALHILVKEENIENKTCVVPTEIAKKYAEKFQEIAIDEYQDSNEVQEYILSSVSRGNNIFMVGDVKQSIYKFRQAMPELFLKKYKTYENVKDENKKDDIDLNLELSKDAYQKGTKIQLFKNFRSRGNVLKFTNLIFENIMSEELGDVNYTEEEYLNLGATDFKENGQDLKTEIDIIDTANTENFEGIQKTNYENSYIEDFDYIEDEFDEEDEDNQGFKQEREHLEDIEIEAKYIANKIKELITQGFQVYDRKAKEFRNICPKDIVILLRSTKNKANIYEQELIKKNLPVFSDSTQEYLNTVEIETIMSLLKIIDNPIQDIPLVTVLRSPIASFTDNELVQIRLSDKYDNFYECMQKAKVNVDINLKNKIGDFLNKLEDWRKEQEFLALDELIWKLYLDTGYYNYVGLMPNGVQRQANLKVLFERAKQYESASFKGLYNFINFIEKLKLSSGDLGSAKIIGENDDVIRIMSIHKSKGLEFPVVFLANSNKQFNKQDIRKDDVLLHQKYGLGIKYIDYNMQLRYETIARQLVKTKIEEENLSEEMRILYVALTRAKEKIYITATGKDIGKKMETLQKNVEIYQKENGKIKSGVLKKGISYLEWILQVYLYNKEKTEEMAKINILQKAELKDLWQKKEDEVAEKTDIEKELDLSKDVFLSDKVMAESVRKNLEFKYPFEMSTKLQTKMSVSEIKKRQGEEILEDENGILDIQLAKPKFLQEDSERPLTGAQKGTIMHLCMQRLDINKDYDFKDVERFVNDLEQNNIITKKEREAIYLQNIYKYTQSSIWKELRTAKKIEREKPFYILLPSEEIYKNNQNDFENNEKIFEGEEKEDISNLKNGNTDKILVQGIIDLYYINQNDELVLLDYKTDFARSEEQLVKKYKVQLDIYKRALQMALGRKVDKVYIYSLYLQKAISV